MRIVHRIVSRVRRIGSGLDRVIPPEINDDVFYRSIIRVAATPGLEHILEIGSSAGAGSTQALVTGALLNRERPAIHCIEVSEPRYEALVKRYTPYDFVYCYRVSSVPLASFPSPAQVEEFHRTSGSKLSMYPLKQVLGWLEKDVAYVTSQEIPTDGIRRIKEQHRIESFGAVLIDGSEFTGIAELREVYGARFILLDDILTYKNHANFRALSTDSAYNLIETSETPRNEYAVFEWAS